MAQNIVRSNYLRTSLRKSKDHSKELLKKHPQPKLKPLPGNGSLLSAPNNEHKSLKVERLPKQNISRKEILDLVNGKFSLLKHPSKTSKQKRKPMSTYQRVLDHQKNYPQSKGQEEDLLAFKESRNNGGLLMSYSDWKNSNRCYPTLSRKECATANMPHAKTSADLKGIIGDMQTCTPLYRNKKPTYGCQFFNVEFFPPTHSRAVFRKSKPAIRVTPGSDLPLNDKKLLMKNQSQHQGSLYPSDYAYLRFEWRRIVKKEFFKAYTDLGAPEGYYTFQTMKYPTADVYPEFVHHMHKAISAVKKFNYTPFVERANKMTNWARVEKLVKFRNYPAVLPPPGVKLKNGSFKKGFNNSKNNKEEKFDFRGMEGVDELDLLAEQMQDEDSNPGNEESVTTMKPTRYSYQEILTIKHDEALGKATVLKDRLHPLTRKWIDIYYRKKPVTDISQFIKE